MMRGLVRTLSAVAPAMLLFSLALVLLDGCRQLDADPPMPTQLDALVAPIALYPDPLLAQVLIAATFPKQVIEAGGWQESSTNAGLTGAALAAAVVQQPWDPSIKAVLQFPQVMHMMFFNLHWTTELGEAFANQQADVADVIQRLRHLALAAGTLVSTPQQTVTVEGDVIVIEPADPQTVYVPFYNPAVAYGAWPYPDAPPDAFPPPPNYAWGPGIGFGVGCVVVDALWGWGDWDWHQRGIRIDSDRYDRVPGPHAQAAGDHWSYAWGHRAPPEPFHGIQPAENFRGYAPEGALRSAPAFESFGRGAEVRLQAARGQASRASSPAPMHFAHSGGGGGGGSRGGGGGGRR
jgi:uncharacterized membrane protein YgcG